MIFTPIFIYKCLECDHEFEKIVIVGQHDMGEADQCPECRSQIIEKMITSPAIISMNGKAGLRSLPDPTPPLQKLKEKGPKEGCEGGYADLEDWTKPVRKGKDKDGNILWKDQKKQYYDLGKK